ncbi:PDZ domain-containing protein [Oceanobacillus neutriphilus]|uniref:PDZ domain-containing protein n=1 Tax=Oceanobacillus neutriphilus TaxID=531815 RepID=UPI00227A74C0
MGTEVLQVKEGSTAYTAEIRPNDIILEMDGEKITSFESFEVTLNKKTVNSYVNLIILRKNKRISVNCMVDNYPTAY